MQHGVTTKTHPAEKHRQDKAVHLADENVDVPRSDDDADTEEKSTDE
jgi:hypothetical protein